MRTSCQVIRVFAIVALAMPVGLGSVQAQEKSLVPGQAKIERQVTIDLAEVGLAGQSTAVRVTIAPGIVTEDHTHAGRTSVLVVVEGALTEVRGAIKKQYRPGDVIAVAEGVTHHAENYGSTPIVYVEINTSAKKP